MYAFVDHDDYDYLKQFRWYGLPSRDGKIRALRSYQDKKTKKKIIIYMAREIMAPDKNVYVDHINRNTLDNRKSNLRFSTNSQNLYNRNTYKPGKSSKYKGVTKKKTDKKYHARIAYEGNKISLGYFDTETDAALAYNKAALIYHGEFAYLNDVMEHAKDAEKCEVL